MCRRQTGWAAQPIVLDTDGRILDGRNRYAACQIAEVEPTFITYDGYDPDGYALMVNIARRHLSNGQQAIVAAKALRMMNGDNESGRKPTSIRQAAKAVSMNHERIVAANVSITAIVRSNGGYRAHRTAQRSRDQ